jgi:hypothetical protein
MVAERDTPIALANVLVMRSSGSPFCLFAIVVAITRTGGGNRAIGLPKNFFGEHFTLVLTTWTSSAQPPLVLSNKRGR